MYIHLGESTVVRDRDIIGIFDIDKTSISKRTRDFLKHAQQTGKVINVSYELPRSFVICRQDKETKVYISQISSATIRKRIENYSVNQLKG